MTTATADIPTNPIPQAYPANNTGAYCLHLSTPNFFSKEYRAINAPTISGISICGNPESPRTKP